MCNYKSILLLLFFISPFLVIAQENQTSFNIAIGEELEQSERESLRTIVGQVEDGFVVLQKKMKRSFGFSRKVPYHLYLQYYNHKLQLQKDEKLKVKMAGEHLTFQFIIQLQDSIFLFASASNPLTGRESLFARPINTVKLKPDGEWKKIAEVENREKDGFFSWTRSADKSKLLLLYSSFSEKLERQNYNLYVFNQELNRLWYKENCLPYPLRRFSIVQCHLDNSGNVYLLNTLFRNGDKDKSYYQYHLLTYKNKGNELHEFGIELPNHFLTEIKITTDQQQNLVGGGFYSNDENTTIKGAYFFKINGETNRVTSKSNVDFTKELIPETFEAQSLAALNLFAEDNREGTHQLRRSGFELNDLLVRKDGSVLLLGEQYFITTTTQINNGFRGASSETNYFYKYKDVLLVSMSKDGTIEWTEKVQKQQHSQDDSGLYGSYLVGQFQDELCLLFNNYSFLEEGREGMVPLRLAETVLVKIGRDGRQWKESVAQLDNRRLRLIPRSGVEVHDGGFLLLGGDEENHHFIKLNRKNKEILSLR